MVRSVEKFAGLEIDSTMTARGICSHPVRCQRHEVEQSKGTSQYASQNYEMRNGLNGLERDRSQTPQLSAEHLQMLNGMKGLSYSLRTGLHAAPLWRSSTSEIKPQPELLNISRIRISVALNSVEAALRERSVKHQWKVKLLKCLTNTNERKIVILLVAPGICILLIDDQIGRESNRPRSLAPVNRSLNRCR